MPRRPLRLLGAVIAGSLVAGACSDDGPSLSVDDLRDAGDTCPVDLETALGDAGLDGGTVEVEAEQGTGDADDDATALDRADGVYVSCTWRPDGHDGADVDGPDSDTDSVSDEEEDSDGEGGDDGARVEVELITAEEGNAALLFLPAVQAGAGLGSGEAQALADRLVDTGDGQRVDLDDDATVALAPVDIDGAASGALFVSGEGVTAEQVDTIADAVLEEL